jgi:GntR family transcriptional regulator/MocR family aminotransferase
LSRTARDRLQATLHGNAHGWADLFGWEIKRDKGTPVFRQVYLQIRLAILSRRLRAGTKLPSTRALASELIVARTSVVAAYEQLLAEGYVSGRIGSGTYISSELPDATETLAGRPKKPAAPEKQSISPQARQFAALAPTTTPGANLPFDAGRALVDVRTTQLWSKLSRRMLISIGPIHLGYSDPRGLIELRTGSGHRDFRSTTGYRHRRSGLAESRRRSLGRRSQLPTHLPGAGCFRRQNSSGSG